MKDYTNPETAQAILSKKERANYYRIYGHNEMTDGIWMLIPYTGEEIVRLKAIIEERGMKNGGLFVNTASCREILDEIDKSEKSAQDLYDLLLEHCEDFDFVPMEIDFENPEHMYRMECRYVDEETGTLSEPKEFHIQMSDEEYIYMLQGRLNLGKNFTFNYLLEYKTEIAKRINKCAGIIVDDESFFYIDSAKPYIVRFTEVEEDCKMYE